MFMEVCMILVDRKRSGWNRIGIALIGVLSIWAIGCSTAKPPVKPAEVAEQPKASATKRLASAPVSQSSNSLEQLQQGQPVGTPASSPLKDIYFDFDRYVPAKRSRPTPNG